MTTGLAAADVFGRAPIEKVWVMVGILFFDGLILSVGSHQIMDRETAIVAAARAAR
jgi:hypothetical protein